MRIEVENKEEQVLITQLCDIALRADGVKNLAGVNLILSSIKGVENEPVGCGGGNKSEIEAEGKNTNETKPGA